MTSREIPIEIIGEIEDDASEKENISELADTLNSFVNSGRPPIRRSRSNNRNSAVSEDGSERSNRASLIITHEDGTVEENPAMVKTLRLSQEDIPGKKVVIEEYLSQSDSSDEECESGPVPAKTVQVEIHKIDPQNSSQDRQDQIQIIRTDDVSAKLCDSSSLQSDEDGEDIQLCGSRTEHFNTAAGRSGVMDEKWTLQSRKVSIQRPSTGTKTEQPGKLATELQSAESTRPESECTQEAASSPSNPDYSLASHGPPPDLESTTIEITIPDNSARRNLPDFSRDTCNTSLHQDPLSSTNYDIVEVTSIAQSEECDDSNAYQLADIQTALDQPVSTQPPSSTASSISTGNNSNSARLQLQTLPKITRNSLNFDEELRNFDETFRNLDVADETETPSSLYLVAVKGESVDGQPVPNSSESRQPVNIQIIKEQPSCQSEDLVGLTDVNGQSLDRDVVEAKLADFGEAKSFSSVDDELASTSIGDITWSPETQTSPPPLKRPLSSTSPQSPTVLTRMDSRGNHSNNSDELEASFEIIHKEKESELPAVEKETRPTEAKVMTIPIQLQPSVEPKPAQGSIPTSTKLLASETSATPTGQQEQQTRHQQSPLLSRDTNRQGNTATVSNTSSNTTSTTSTSSSSFTKSSTTEQSSFRKSSSLERTVFFTSQPSSSNLITGHNQPDPTSATHSQSKADAPTASSAAGSTAGMAASEAECLPVRIIPIKLDGGQILENVKNTVDSEEQAEPDIKVKKSSIVEEEKFVKLETSRQLSGGTPITITTNAKEQESGEVKGEKEKEPHKSVSEGGGNETRSIPIQLESGEIIKPHFENLQEMAAPSWSIFHLKGNESERHVPIQVENLSARDSNISSTTSATVTSQPQRTSQTKSPSPAPILSTRPATNFSTTTSESRTATSTATRKLSGTDSRNPFIDATGNNNPAAATSVEEETVVTTHESVRRPSVSASSTTTTQRLSSSSKEIFTTVERSSSSDTSTLPNRTIRSSATPDRDLGATGKSSATSDSSLLEGSSSTMSKPSQKPSDKRTAFFTQKTDEGMVDSKDDTKDERVKSFQHTFWKPGTPGSDPFSNQLEDSFAKMEDSTTSTSTTTSVSSKAFDKSKQQPTNSSKGQDDVSREQRKQSPPFVDDTVEPQVFPNVTRSSKSEFITSRAEFVCESTEIKTPVGAEEKLLGVAESTSKPPSGVRNIPIRKVSQSLDKDATLPSSWTPKEKQSPVTSESGDANISTATGLPPARDAPNTRRSYSTEERISTTQYNSETCAKKEALDSLKRVEAELEAARRKLTSEMEEITGSLPFTTNTAPASSRLKPVGGIGSKPTSERMGERSKSVESDRLYSQRKSSTGYRPRFQRERSLQDIDKDIETIWRELQELDKLPVGPTPPTVTPATTSATNSKASDRPPSAPPSLSQQNLVTPPWRIRNRTASGNNTTDSTIYKTRTSVREIPVNSNPRTIWDPINNASNKPGELPAKYPATPVQAGPTLSSSWDTKPNYFPTTANHFSFLPKPETKPGYITPTYVSSSPRTARSSARTVPIVQQTQQTQPQASPQTSAHQTSQSRPDIGQSKPSGGVSVRNVPINQTDGSRPGRSSAPGESIRPFPRDPSTGRPKAPGDTAAMSTPFGTMDSGRRSTSTERRETKQTYSGSSGLKSCLKNEAKSFSTLNHESQKQNVIFKKAGSEDKCRVKEDTTPDYDWIDISHSDAGGKEKSMEGKLLQTGTMSPKATQTSNDVATSTSNSPVNVPINVIGRQDSTPLNVKIEQNSKTNSPTATTNPFECGDCHDKQTVEIANGRGPSSPCDACTQTEKLKKSNCRVM